MTNRKAIHKKHIKLKAITTLPINQLENANAPKVEAPAENEKKQQQKKGNQYVC